ncbi:nitroreductase family protein [Salisediminibacterium beveridgei]|uniref:NADPH-dependent oxidoreductase n=1 Tax=Salisediminibacterium beveridgei TaxID=632773 RepID=A0A1D7QRJ7_9BACI|nr:nitroreductase family protein [Salisediminibacterium beveridgei]AOM81628.1 NADPH-dependent oxidoreductase [Salisediminibacterium beveridgei]
MSEVLSQMNEHRSVRVFKPDPVADALIEEILEGARKAPTSHHLQPYSVIRVKGPAKRRRLAELAGGQQYVAPASVFLIDYYKHHMLANRYETPLHLQEIDNLLVGALDTGIIAENALLAAQSKGLGRK